MYIKADFFCAAPPRFPPKKDIFPALYVILRSMAKHLYIISGCNGAGKTTASFTVLPQILECDEFVNADEIARGLSPFSPESVAVAAGRLMLERINLLLVANKSFSIETTLATRSYIQLIRRAKSLGYTTHLLYFWLESPDLAIIRVAKRVREGGHNIPEQVIRRRYRSGLLNFVHLYKDEVDEWSLYDNNLTNSRAVAIRRAGSEKEEVINPFIYSKIKKLWQSISQE